MSKTAHRLSVKRHRARLRKVSSPSLSVRPRVRILDTSHIPKSQIWKEVEAPNILTSGLRLEDYEDELCRRDLFYFVRRVVKTLSPAIPFKENWHHRYMCEWLEVLEQGGVHRIVFNVPPRTLKSVICSVAFPAQLLGHTPSQRIICASYVDRVSTELSVDCRTIIESDWYKRMYPETILADDQNEKTKYKTTEQGFRRSSSVGSSITGAGGVYKILDDPIDPERGFSAAERERTTRWLDHTWSSREDDPMNTRELLVMQRIHVFDPTALMLARGGWELIKIPQEAPCKVSIRFPISGEVVIREKGDLLHPDRFGPVENEMAKKTLGSYGYSAQHQQEPIPQGGNRIQMEWFPRYSALPVEWDEVVFSLDTATSTKKLSCPSAMLIFGRKGASWYLVKSTKERVAYPALKRMVKSAAAHYHPDTVLIENKSSGQSLIQDLSEDPEFPYPIIKMEPESDKPMRMEVQLSSIEAGLIILPEAGLPGTEWLYSLEVNLSSFPTPKEWDEIDALSQFLKWTKKKDAQQFTSEGLDSISDVGTKQSDWKFN